jgi:hypothetical protein
MHLLCQPLEYEFDRYHKGASDNDLHPIVGRRDRLFTEQKVLTTSLLLRALV